MSEVCKEHNIKQVHGAPRNCTVKENMNNIINEDNEEMANWGKILNKAAYKKNIVEHSATGKMKQCLEFCLEKNYTLQILLKKNVAVKPVRIQTRGNTRRITLQGRK